jgi:hypothetical protein
VTPNIRANDIEKEFACDKNVLKEEVVPILKPSVIQSPGTLNKYVRPG